MIGSEELEPVLSAMREAMGLVTKDTADGVLEPVPDVGQLEKSGQYRHQDARSHQQYQHGDSPDEIVDGAVDTGDRINKACKIFFQNNLLLLCFRKISGSML